jgi:hypothetical protein
MQGEQIKKRTLYKRLERVSYKYIFNSSFDSIDPGMSSGRLLFSLIGVGYVMSHEF